VYIVMIASECAPVAQAGGLGEVIPGLSRELEIRGNAVEIVLPKYDSMRSGEIHELQVTHDDLWVPWYNGAIRCTVWFGFVHGRKCFFLEPHSPDNFFGRGQFYGASDDEARFAFFSKAALEFLLKADKRPDIIHCHDWQTGLVPVLLYEVYQQLGMDQQRVCYTIHNVSHQGVAGEDVLWATGLTRPDYFFDYDRLRDNADHSAINLMKAGIVYSNFVTTVSPQHAWEVAYTDQGMGLQDTFQTHQANFGGVLNGVDYDVWNPEVDRFIAANFTIDTLDRKYENRKALRERLLLSDDHKPVVGYVGRLARQKGVDLIKHAIFYAMEEGAQFVLTGSSSDADVHSQFSDLKQQLNDRPDCHLEIDFDEALAHLIYAGADILLIPSLFEPCGLAQMIAFKYGTVPVVRAVGGLVDTVFDRDHSSRPLEERNGYVFHEADDQAVESALARALGLWHSEPDQFRELIKNGMRADHSWGPPSQDYMTIYEQIRDT
jgi:starch synthase